MHRMASIALLCTVLELISCASISPITAIKEIETQEVVTQRKLLIGTWQGETPVVGGGTRIWTTQRNADGTFRVDFINANVIGVPFTQSEIGIWGVSGSIYFTATRGFIDSGVIVEAETENPALYDTYKIIALDAEKFEYKNLSTGSRFFAKRVFATSSAIQH